MMCRCRAVRNRQRTVKSVGYVVAGLAGQVAVALAFYGVSHLDPGISDHSFLVLLTSALTMIGVVSTIAAGLAATGRARVWSFAASGLFFAAVVFYVAVSAFSLYEHQ